MIGLALAPAEAVGPCPRPVADARVKRLRIGYSVEILFFLVGCGTEAR